jgi:hypothetical protein
MTCLSAGVQTSSLALVRKGPVPGPFVLLKEPALQDTFHTEYTDIQGFFDNLDKSWLIKFVAHRVADLRILRLIRKWLNAGVMEEGKWPEPQTGTPQGSVISTASR